MTSLAGTNCTADYHAVIADRNGAVIVDLAVIVEVEFDRVLNDASTARVKAVPDLDCCGSLGNIRTWRHQLYLYRNRDFVWGGPVISAEWVQGGFEVEAADVLVWMAVRLPHEDLSFVQVDTATIAESLIENGFQPDDPGHTVEILGASGVLRSVAYAEDDEAILESLKDLADDGGLDFTAVGSTIMILPDDWDANIGLITDADLPEGLSVAEDGSALATRWVVFGTDDSGAKGVAGGVDPYYGLIERVAHDSSITDDATAQASAEARLAASLNASVYIDTREVTLSSETALDVTQIVPGWCVDLATTATCRDISQRFKITGLQVVADGDGEQIKIQLGPISQSSATLGV
jgi:hypothetical protein